MNPSKDMFQFQTKINQATRIKNEGNFLFKKHNYQKAKNKYQEALKMLGPTTHQGISESLLHRHAELYSALLFNVGSCFFNINKWKEAVNTYNEALIVNPNYVKAYYKRAMAQLELKDYENAMVDIKKAYGLDSNNSDILDGYEKIRVKYNEQLKKDHQNRKKGNYFNFYSKNKEKIQQQSSNNTKWWMLLLVPLAAVAIYQGVKYSKSK